MGPISSASSSTFRRPWPSSRLVAFTISVKSRASGAQRRTSPRNTWSLTPAKGDCSTRQRRCLGVPLPGRARGGESVAIMVSRLSDASAMPSAPASLPQAYPLSRALLEAVLADRTSDRFVCELVWQRLGYQPAPGDGSIPIPWVAGAETPASWAEAFPQGPEVIAQRPASVALTRSVLAPHKQLLKQQLGFAGYRIGELYPRRTRRATAVNWLLAQLAEQGDPLPDTGPLPSLFEPPADPRSGHPGDLPVG